VIVGELCTGFSVKYTFLLTNPGIDGIAKLNLPLASIQTSLFVSSSNSVSFNSSNTNLIQTIVFGNGPTDNSAVFKSTIVSPLVDTFASGTRISSGFPYVFASVKSIPTVFVNQSVSWNARGLVSYDMSSLLVSSSLNYDAAKHVFVIGTLPTQGTLYVGSTPITTPNTILSNTNVFSYVPTNSNVFSTLSNTVFASTPAFDTFTFFLRDTTRTYPNRVDSFVTATATLYVVHSPRNPYAGNSSYSSVSRTSNTIVSVSVSDPDDSTTCTTPGVVSTSRLYNGTKLIASTSIQFVTSTLNQNFGLLYMCDCATPITTFAWIPITSFCDPTQFTFCYLPRASPLNPSVLHGTDTFSFNIRDPSGLVSTVPGTLNVTLANPLTMTSSLVSETSANTAYYPNFVAKDSYTGRQLRFRITSLPKYGTLYKNGGNTPIVIGDEFQTGPDGKTIVANSIQYVPYSGYFNFVRYAGSSTSGWPYSGNTDPFVSGLVFQTGTFVATPRASFADKTANRIFANLLNQPIDGCVGLVPASSCRCNINVAPGCPDSFQLVIVAYVSANLVSDVSDPFTASVYVQAIATGQLNLVQTLSSSSSSSSSSCQTNYTTYFFRNRLNPLSVSYVVNDPNDNVFAVSVLLNPDPGSLAITLPSTTSLSASSPLMFPYLVLNDLNALNPTSIDCLENGCDTSYRILMIPAHISSYLLPKLSFLAPISSSLPDDGTCLTLSAYKPTPFGIVDRSIPPSSSPVFYGLSYTLTLDPSAPHSNFGAGTNSFLNSPMGLGIMITIGVLVVVVIIAVAYNVKRHQALTDHLNQPVDASMLGDDDESPSNKKGKKRTTLSSHDGMDIKETQDEHKFQVEIKRTVTPNPPV
jgi:hypothetical protein